MNQAEAEGFAQTETNDGRREERKLISDRQGKTFDLQMIMITIAFS